MALTWLNGDMHCHCERHELLEALLDGVPERLDFLALTNHPHKPIFAEQAEQIARARKLLPDFPIFFGCEWNGLGGRHTNVIFPPSRHEADHALAFLREYDFVITGREPDLGRAFAQLQALPPAERPVVFINHPAEKIGFTPEHLDRLCAAGGDLFIGMEGLHGHQAWTHVLENDPTAYPASRMGGLCDHLALHHSERPVALLAHSDFHVHKQDKTPDYPPGAFNHTRVAVLPGAATGTRDERAAAIFAGLRAGRTCAAQGRWFHLHEFSVGDATLGGRTVTTRSTRLTIRGEAREAVWTIELIGSLTPVEPPHVLHAWRDLPAGPVAYDWPVPAGASGFVRLRVTAAENSRPPIPAVGTRQGLLPPPPQPPPPASRLVLTAAIRLASAGSRAGGLA